MNLKSRLNIHSIFEDNRFNLFILFSFVVALAIAAYWSILNNTLLGDDFAEINRIYKIPASELWRLFLVTTPRLVRPIPYFIYWFHYNLFGFAGWPSHLINVLLHTGSAFVLFLLLKTLSIKRLTAFFVSTLFLLTPLAPEAVTWSDGRFDTTVLLFILLTLYLFALTLEGSHPYAYGLALVTTAAAFLCKESAIILIVLIPLMELLFHPLNRFGSQQLGWKDRLTKSTIRVAPFFATLVGLFIFRYWLLGGIGGTTQTRIVGYPNIKAPIRTIFTLMSPLDLAVVDRKAVLVLGAYVGAIALFAALFVIFRWKKASAAARRTLIFFLCFYFLSLLPTYASSFIEGMNNHLTNSRFFYVPNAAFITLLVVAFMEFGWVRRSWRVGAAAALVMLMPMYFWGLNQNNHIWERDAAINYHLINEAPRLLPDPPPNAKLYFKNLPMANGSHWYGVAIKNTMNLTYGREDLQVYYVDPEPFFGFTEKHAVFGGAPKDGFVFSFDRETGQLSLISEPETE